MEQNSVELNICLRHVSLKFFSVLSLPRSLIRQMPYPRDMQMVCTLFLEIEINQPENILSDCDQTRTHNHLVHKQTLKHLAELATIQATIECEFTLKGVRYMTRTYSRKYFG